MQARSSPRLGAFSWGLLPALALSCGAEPLTVEGQYGRPMALASGDRSPLPRLVFIDQGCAGTAVAGGCPSLGEDGCQTLLIDSLSPITTLRDPDAERARISVECLEVRPARDLLATDLPDDVLDARFDDAVARFRFDELPIIRTPPRDGWSWTAGDQAQTTEPGGVLGGNLLRNFAVAIRSPRLPRQMDQVTPDPATITLFGEYPGSEGILADQGRAFLPLQFPGRLLGRELTDRCAVGEDPCEVDGFDLSTSASELPLLSSLMVMDACVAIPPCAVRYDANPEEPFGEGTCTERRGPTSATECVDPTDETLGGRSASLVVATGVPGLVLFSDSAARMFGDLAQLDPCPEPLSPTTEFNGGVRACRIGDDGVLHVAGWPAAGEDAPLTRLRVRSLALVPGAERSRSAGPCERADQRRFAAYLQCDRYQRTALNRGDIRDTAPPYSAELDATDEEDHASDPGATSLAVLGEAALQPGSSGPRPARWITTTILPAEHPLAQSVRRTVAPDALEPDGLLGTALFANNEVVLDYTDLNPALRIACLDPHDGRCQVLPDCREDQRRACCHGMPLTLLDEFIRTLDDDTCCSALAADELSQLASAGHCVGVLPP